MRTVQVIYHEELDGWWAESPDVAGFGAAGDTLPEVRELARTGLPFYLDEVEVELDELFPTPLVSSWITGLGSDTKGGASDVSVVAHVTPAAPVLVRAQAA